MIYGGDSSCPHEDVAILSTCTFKVQFLKRVDMCLVFNLMRTSEQDYCICEEHRDVA